MRRYAHDKHTAIHPRRGENRGGDHRIKKRKPMDEKLLQKKFEAMGARVKIRLRSETASRNERSLVPIAPASGVFQIDIRHDTRGDYFDLLVDPGIDLDVIDHRAKERHLLLMARDGKLKDKFLCGHDERHWFVAAVPEMPGVSSVITAMEALKPDLVIAEQAKKKLNYKSRFHRKNKAFIRQGEWFFIPVPQMQKDIDPKEVLSNEPLSRGGGKPHYCQFLYRRGGVEVFVCREHPQGVSVKTHQKMLQTNPDARNWNWRQMRQNPEAYVRGWVAHPDHATIYLDGWHRVAMNTENKARSMSKVVFLD
jgi:hypothetical protein